jgi:hypothetical protein
MDLSTSGQAQIYSVRDAIKVNRGVCMSEVRPLDQRTLGIVIKGIDGGQA